MLANSGTGSFGFGNTASSLDSWSESVARSKPALKARSSGLASMLIVGRVMACVNLRIRMAKFQMQFVGRTATCIRYNILRILPHIFAAGP